MSQKAQEHGVSFAETQVAVIGDADGDSECDHGTAMMLPTYAAMMAA